MIWLRTPPIREGRCYDSALCAGALGLEPRELLPIKPQLLSAGNPTVIVAAKDKAAVDRAWLDLAGLKSLKGAESEPLCVSRLPPIRGHTSSVFRHGLRGVGCLKQLPKPVFQQFDGLRQGAKLPSPDDRDGRVQVKRWRPQYFHGIDRMIPGNEASRQQPDTITGLNER